MARAQGARAQMALAFEAVYGTPPAANQYWKIPFASSGLGSERGLLANELLGYGRDPLPPTLDVETADGDIVVPIDLRFWGIWLKAAFGAPETTPIAATGSIVFSEQPAAGSTITINGTEFTFVETSPSSDEIEIGMNLAATLDNMVSVLNGSVDSDVDDATYSDDNTETLIITHDTAGPGGNAFTLAASANSNGTVSGATLSGGAYSHVFETGAFTLPSMAIETGMPEVPHYAMAVGVMVNTLNWQMQRSGLLTATAGLIAQGENVAASSAAGTLNEMDLVRFGQFNGAIKRDSVSLGNVVSAQVTYNNNLDRIETIRDDGKIDGADPSIAALTGSIDVRFASQDLINQAVDGTPSELTFSYTRSPAEKFELVAHAVYLPKPRLSLTGPQGVQASFEWQAAFDSGEDKMATVTLVNDVADYDNPGT